MLTLIKNELFKIFHKKNVFVFIFIVILYAFLITYSYKQLSKIDADNSSTYSNWGPPLEARSYYQDILATAESDSYDYISAKASLETLDLLEKYPSTDWRRRIIQENYQYIAMDYYRSLNNQYGGYDEVDYNKIYHEYRTALENNDWKYFVAKEIENKKSQLNDYVNDASQVYVLKEEIRLLEYRQKENIGYGNDYLNNAIKTMNNTAYTMYDYINTEESKKASFEDLERVQEYYKAKYMLENKIDTSSANKLNKIIPQFFSQYSFLIIVFGIMIAGSIVSEEFSKGTIKSLLTTPYKRSKILLSKLITSLLLAILFVIFTMIIQFIIGIIFFGTEGMDIPILVYHYGKEMVESISLLKYLSFQFIANLPIIILMTTLAFTISTLFTNSALAIALPICGYIGSSIINNVVLYYDSKIMLLFRNYFVTPNWDFTYYLFGGSSPYGISFMHAVIVCLSYMAIMVILAFIEFKRKDIKNI